MHHSIPLAAFLCGLLTLMLSGCASPFDVGPDYQSPSLDAPPAFRGADPTDSDVALSRRWWKLFDDPVLDELIEQALAHNQDLQAAAYRVDQARALAGEARAELFPRLAVEAEGGRHQNPQTAYQPSEYVSLHGLLSYELDLWGSVKRGASAARSEAEAAQNRFDAARLSLSAQVAETVYLLRASRIEQGIVADSIEARRETRDVIAAQYTLGTATDLDLSRAETELALAEAELVAVARRSARLGNALALLCGRPAPTFPLESVGTGLPSPPVVPDALPASVLRHRPDVAAAEDMLAAAADRIGVARAAFYPSVRLTATGGWESDDFDSVLSDGTRIWSIGPQIYLPIFQGNRNRGRLAHSVATYKEREAVFRQTVLVALREVQDALTASQLLQDQESANDRATAAAHRTAALSRARYNAGLVGYLEVVDGERVALAAERTQTRLLVRRIAATIHLIKALGGGWNESSAVAEVQKSRPHLPRCPPSIYRPSAAPSLAKW